MIDRAGVEQQIVGHKITFLRHADNQRVRWAIDKGGSLFGDNLTLGTRDTARWTLNDKGELCLKWRGNSVDGCRAFGAKDGKTLMFDTTAPTVVFATLETIE